MQKSAEDVTRLMEEFHWIKMGLGESTSAYIGPIEYITSQLAAANEALEDNMMIFKIITVLPDSYSTFRTSWRAEPNPSLPKLQSRLMAEEKDRGTFDSVALLANKVKGSRRRVEKTPGDKKNCCKCGMEGHWKKDCRQSPKQQSKKNEGGKYANAHGTEAFVAESGFSSQDETEMESDEFLSENHIEDVSYGLGVVESKDESNTEHLVESILSEKSSDWINDSGATDHMTHDRSIFITYNEYKGPRVVRYGGVTGSQKIAGIGTIEVQSIVEKGRLVDLLLKDVLYEPGSRRNLISTCHAYEQGYSGWHDDEIYRLVNKKTGKTSMIGKSIERIFYANIKVQMS